MPNLTNDRITDCISVVGAVLPQSVTTAVLTDAIDTSKYGRVLFIAKVGTPGAAAVVTFVIQSSTTAAGTYTALANQNIGNDTTGSHIWLIEVSTPNLNNSLGVANGTDTWLKGSIASATAATICDVTAIGVSARYLPVTQDAAHVQAAVVSLAG